MTGKHTSITKHPALVATWLISASINILLTLVAVANQTNPNWTASSFQKIGYWQIVLTIVSLVSIAIIILDRD